MENISAQDGLITEINKNRNKTNEKNTAKVKSILERLLEYKPKMCQYVYKEPL